MPKATPSLKAAFRRHEVQIGSIIVLLAAFFSAMSQDFLDEQRDHVVGELLCDGDHGAGCWWSSSPEASTFPLPQSPP